MPVTFEDLRDSESIRSEFMGLTEDQRELAFDKIPSPQGFTPEQTELLKTKILSIPTASIATGEQDLPPAWKDVPLEALKNIPRSSIELAKNIWSAVSSPFDTIEALKGIALGGVAKLIPGDQQGLVLPGSITPVDEQGAEQMAKFFIDRFGGDEALRRTISEDPIGFLLDLSAVAGGVGGIAKVAGLAKTGQIVSKAAPFIDPLTAAGKGVGAVISAKTPVNSIIKTALQFPKKAGLQRVDQLADEFIKGGFHLNRKSLMQLDSKIKNVQGKIKQIVSKKTAQGIEIETSKIANAIDDLIKEADKSGLGGVDLPLNIKQLTRLKDNFIKANKQLLTPDEVQQLKVGLNKAFKPDLGNRFSMIKAKANDKLRSAAMKELEDLHPQLKELNADQGVMIELRKAIESQLLSLEKSPTVPVRGLIAGGVAGTSAALVTGAGTAGQALVGGATFAIVSLVVGKILTSPKIQISIARALAKANSKLAKAGKLNLITQPAFQAGRIQREADTNRRTNRK